MAASLKIFDTIVKGRPRGMPTWGGRIPENQIWQIVAYVRSLSGQEPTVLDCGTFRSSAEKKSGTARNEPKNRESRWRCSYVGTRRLLQGTRRF